MNEILNFNEKNEYKVTISHLFTNLYLDFNKKISKILESSLILCYNTTSVGF